MKKILLIAYSFPPVAMTRSRRAVKLSKYLKFFGWEPVVLTAKNPFVAKYDFTLQGDFLDKNIAVVRTLSLEPISLAKKIKGNDYHDSRITNFHPRKKILSKLFLKIKDLIFYPDSRILWMPTALIVGAKLIKKYKIDVIMAIGEPFSSFLTGVFLKFLTRKPLVIDFRDEWVEVNKYRNPLRPRILCRLDERIESLVIKEAEFITVTTEAIKKVFISRYPEYKNKFYCLPNGFDIDDFDKNDYPECSGEEKLIITYCGSIYSGRTIRFFLKALEELLSEHLEFRQKIKFVFVGSKDVTENNYFENFLFKDNIEDYDFLPYKLTIEKMMRSHILLCLEEGDKLIARRYIPGKIYEYLATGKPILALVSDGGEIADLIKITESGTVIQPNDADEIKSFLLSNLIEINKKGYLSDIRKEGALEKFTYKKSAGYLAELLDSLFSSKI